MPLVFAMHATRPPLDLSLQQARALLAGDVTDWTALGEPASPLRIIAGPGAGDVAVIARARSDTAAMAAVETRRDAIAIVPAAALGPSARALTVDGIHPLLDPVTYPLKVTGEPAGPVTTLILVGDIMLARRVGDRLRTNGDDAFPFRLVAEQLSAADLTIGNLESALARLGPPTQSDAFAADPRARAGLTLAGFDLLSLANNHTGDFGPRSLLETIQQLRAVEIPTVGAGGTRRDARRPVILERHGVRFGFLAFNAIGETPAATADQPGAVQIRMQPRTGPLNQRDLDAFTNMIAALRPRVDVLVVLPHWGAQYTHERHRDQRRVARALAQAGADLIIGGHPHWVQGVDLLDETFVAYSLGNFVFDMDFMQQTQEAIAIELVFWGSELKAADLLPVRVGSDFRPRFVSAAAGDSILRDIWRHSPPPFRLD